MAYSSSTKKCTSGRTTGKACGAKLEARMIQRAQTTAGDLNTIIFAKSLAVLICSKCDQGGTATLPPASSAS
jgi:hypothetical protein